MSFFLVWTTAPFKLWLHPCLEKSSKCLNPKKNLVDKLDTPSPLPMVFAKKKVFFREKVKSTFL